MLIILVYLAGFAGALYYSHKREDTDNHEDIGMQCMMWPIFLSMSILLLLMRIPEYLSKLVKRLVR